MLPCIEKLIEKVAYNQLNKFICERGILNINQSGFRKLHSCESAIHNVLFDWNAARDRGEIIVAVFLDFQRAFETIDPKILLRKLRKYGVSERALKWFAGYLEHRCQVVRIGNTTSNPLDVEFGVPQGSILGPLLFNLYINDLGDELRWSIMKLFADDTLDYACGNFFREIVARINEDLRVLFDKICQYKLKLNVTKTKAMIVTGQRFDRNEVDILINGERIEIVDKIKYLGVIIDDRLDFKNNSEYVCGKVGKKTGVLSRLRNELTFGQKMLIYKTVVEPHFTYCSSILFQANNGEIDRLQKLQNKCMRSILKVNRFTNVSAMLSTLEILSVRQLIIFNTIVFIHKMVTDQTPAYLTVK